MTRIPPVRLWIGRGFIACVLLWNVQAALAFLISPTLFVSGFELSGATGAAMVRGMGLLFLMWNVPYAVAFWHPVRRRTSLHEAIAMQAIGLVGESLILRSLGGEHAAAAATLTRFIVFDGAGLALLVLSARVTRGR